MKMNQKRSVWSMFIMLFLAAFVCCISPVEVMAEDAVVETKEDGNFTYTRYESGLCVISGSGELIPGSTGRDVINNASSVKIEGATSIGYRVFMDCSNLNQIDIPNSVTSIGDYAFYGCSSLIRITIPASVTTIKQNAFLYCSKLSTAGPIDSGANIQFGWTTSIPDNAFYSCSSLTEITIPDGITSIGYNAFNGCSSLTRVIIPDSVTSIGDYAFCGYNNLKTAGPIGSGADYQFGWSTDIPANAFSGCYYLTQITFPQNVTSIGNNAFESCEGLTEVTIPSSVTTIGSGSFYDCSSLIQVSIPDSVKSIGTYAFCDCTSLTQITIPDSVTRIREGLFDYCSSLEQVTIPDSVTSIGDYAFYCCSSLTEITIPDNVTNIGDGAFKNCTNLKEITGGLNVTDCGSDIFYGVNNPIIKGYDNTFLKEYAANAGIPFESIGSAYKVTFDYDEYAPNDPITSKIVAVDGKYGKLPEIDTQYADKFDGWYTSKTGGEKITEDTVVNLTENTVLYARIKGYTNIIHTAKKVEMIAATCTTNGNIAYWYCDSCSKYFGDENCKNEITRNDTVIKAKGHTSVPVAVVPATMKADGKTAGTKCSTCGTILSGCETIPKIASVSLSAATYKWDGKVKNPALTINASDGTTIPAAYYTVTKSSGRKNVGKYDYKVVFKGNYSGTKSLSFTINPKGATQTKPAALAKGFTAKWKKVSTKMSSSRITGYQVRYSMKSNMASSKIKTVSGYSKTSVKITKLKPKKKYYIQVRTYKTVNNVKYYSTWSAKKTVITK